MGIAERRERERLRRRNQILDAAEALFVQKGYESTSMESIAQGAEVSKGTLYLYFASRDSVHAAVAERHMSRTAGILSERVTGAATGLEGILAFLETLAEEFTRTHCRLALQGLALGENKSSPAIEARNKKRQEMSDLIVATVVRGQKDGTIRVGLDPFLVAMQVWSGFMGMSLYRYGSVLEEMDPSADPNQLLPTFLSCTLHGLAGEKADLASIPAPSASMPSAYAAAKGCQVGVATPDHSGGLRAPPKPRPALPGLGVATATKTPQDSES